MTVSTPSDLDPPRIAEHVQTIRYGRSLDVRGETGSTMDDARAAAEGGAVDGHVVLADRQRAGRGAHGRNWSSPPGTDLYLSLVARPSLDAARRPLVTLATAIGIAEAVDELAGVRAEVKWPNDVRIRGRKCAGILVETASGVASSPAAGALVIGIGMDINRRHWPAELRATAVSLAEAREDGRSLDRAHALGRVLEKIEHWIDLLVAEGANRIVEALDRRLALRGQHVTCNGAEGIFEGIGPSGAARIRTANGVEELLAGRLEPA